MNSFFRPFLLLALGSALSPHLQCAELKDLKQSLTFYASFDQGPNATRAAGDPLLYHAPSMNHPRTGTPGLPESRYLTLAKGAGRFGDALQFHRKSQEMVFFKGPKNFPYKTNNWNGTVSLWLKVEPQEELATGFCDPIQITDKEWDKAAFFVEFEKREKTVFRLGVYADYEVWNPGKRDWSTIPAQEKPLLTVEKPPFARDKWTHVAFTFENFNTGQTNGVARLYLNGQTQGALPKKLQTFTWKPNDALIMFGLGYVGLFDELAVFSRALTPEEIRSLYTAATSLDFL
jgi:hypothetical protein